MKNTKGFVLLVIVAASMFVSPVNGTISPQTGKKVCYVIGSIAALTMVNGLQVEAPIEEFKKAYGVDGLSGVSLGLVLTPITWLVRAAFDKQINHHINTFAIGGALGIIGSVAAWFYFNNQIKAQSQSKSLSEN